MIPRESYHDGSPRADEHVHEKIGLELAFIAKPMTEVSPMSKSQPTSPCTQRPGHPGDATQDQAALDRAVYLVVPPPAEILN